MKRRALCQTAGVLAYYLHDLSPFLLEFGGGWGIRWYGLAYLAAFLVGWWMYRALARRGYSCLRPEQVGDFIFGGAIFGVILGGRLGYMLFYDFEGFVSDPLRIFRIYEGGMSAHGGILGLALFSLWYARRHRLPWLSLGDNLVVVAPVGLFFGRLANFINGELYGRVTDVAWAVVFPRALYDEPPEVMERVLGQAMQWNPAWGSIEAVARAAGRSPELAALLRANLEPRHPSQIYEALLEGALFFVGLWLVRTRWRVRDGVLTGLFFIGYGILRSFCEVFREPDAPLVGSLTRGQFLSIFLVLAGAGFLWASRSGQLRPAAQHLPARSPSKKP